MSPVTIKGSTWAVQSVDAPNLLVNNIPMRGVLFSNLTSGEKYYFAWGDDPLPTQSELASMDLGKLTSMLDLSVKLTVNI